MRAFIVEITAKVICRSDTSADDLPENLYSRISEHVGDADDILDLTIEVIPLPLDLCGSTPH